ncbi:MAG: PorV/PorQ family protein [bacterium]
MKKLLIILIFVLSITLVQKLICQEATNSASFMRIGSGARAIALGSAFVAVADDALAGYCNPAGLTQLKAPAISIADRIPVMDTDYASIAIASPIFNFGYIGLSGIYYGCGDIIMYDENGLDKGVLNDKEAAVILSYAYKLNQLSLGVNAKYIYQGMSADDGSATSDGVGADISLLYRVYENLAVGAIFHSKYKVTDKNNSEISSISPLNIQAGVNYRFDLGKNLLNFMLDLNQTKSYPLKMHFGTELIFYDSLALRAGLDDIYMETKTVVDHIKLLQHNAKPTFGLGLKWRIGKSQSVLMLDYALSVEKLGLRNFLTIGYKF